MGKPPFILLSFWNISESKLDALLNFDFAALNICAILREYRRLHAPRDAHPADSCRGTGVSLPGMPLSRQNASISIAASVVWNVSTRYAFLVRFTPET